MILILGCRRSGTTLLRTILARHPALAVHREEPQFIIDTWRQHGWQIRQTAAAARRMATHPYSQPEVTVTALLAQLGSSAPTTLSALTNAYLAQWLGNDSRPPVLKYPQFALHLPLLDRLFPEAKMVHVVRSPHGSVASQRSRWPQLSTWECAVEWRRSVQLADDWARRHPKRAYVVQYERLISEPAATLRALCGFLGVAFSAELLDFQLDTWSYTADGQRSATQFNRFDATKLTQWRERLSPAQLGLIDHCCNVEMAAHGYKRQADQALSHAIIRRERLKFGLLAAGRWGKARGRAVGRWFR